jgi:hypothetical protein
LQIRIVCKHTPNRFKEVAGYAVQPITFFTRFWQVVRNGVCPTQIVPLYPFTIIKSNDATSSVLAPTHGQATDTPVHVSFGNYLLCDGGLRLVLLLRHLPLHLLHAVGFVDAPAEFTNSRIGGDALSP